MKITILLCALATIASAVPSNYHENLHEQKTVLENIPVTIQREKKSPLHDHHEAEMALATGTEDTHTQTLSKSGHLPMEGRSLGIKKPIIVKKKIGYHVYRDSDEEMAHADPHENCRKQVKVKLCEEELGSPKNMVKCFTTERFNEEKEIENSIKTAKEAVENLQRGLHKMEHNSAKLANTEDKELEDDLAVHQQIEAARKALDHVHQNFGNLDTVTLQAIAPKTEEFQLRASSDEERLAQWKEAIDNIQKNFEIARNIEDAFKSDTEQTNLQSTHVDDSSKIRESEHTEPIVDTKHKSNTGSLSNIELLSDGTDPLQKLGESDSDMFTAPTENKALKIELHSDSLKSEIINEEPLNNHETETRDTTNINTHTPTMKNSEFTSTVEGSLKTEAMKSDNQHDVNVHAQHLQSKAVNDFNPESEKLKTSEGNLHGMKVKTEKTASSEIEDITPLMKDKSHDNEDNLEKSAHVESLDQTIKHHDMSMEASDVSTHQSHLEGKVSANLEMEKSKHKTDEAKTLHTEGKDFEQSLKAKSVHDFDDHHKHIERMNHGIPQHIQEKETHNTNMNTLKTNMAQDNHRNSATKMSKEQPILSEDSTNMRSADEKLVKFTPTKGFSNEQHNINTHSFMRMFEDQNMEHKLNEMHDSHLDDHLGSRMTEDQNSFLMRWAHENQHRSQESPLSITDNHKTPTKLNKLNNGQHFHNEHTSMRLNHDNTGHQFTVNHEQDPLSMQWAKEKQQSDLSQMAKSTNAFPETMRLNHHHNMQNHVTENHNLHDLFLMRMAQEKQQHDHLKTLSEFHGHEIPANNGFAHSLVNTQDLTPLGPRMNEHLHMMKHAIVPDMDSAMQPSMHMGMRDAMGQVFEQNEHFNHHHHAMARYGSPMPGASSGAVGLFPNANTGGCGIPLMLSCSPSVVTGTLSKAQGHPGAITAPAYRSGDDAMFYMKRDAKDTDELPTIKIQKSSIPFNHKPELIFDKTQ